RPVEVRVLSTAPAFFSRGGGAREPLRPGFGGRCRPPTPPPVPPGPVIPSEPVPGPIRLPIMKCRSRWAGAGTLTRTLTILAATAATAFALVAIPRPAGAQVVVVAAGSSTVFAPQTVSSVVCEVRREQFTDEHGWRVRDVLVCSPR